MDDDTPDDSFAYLAQKWAAFAVWTWGWRPDDFWRATPHELQQMMDFYACRQQGNLPDKANIAQLRRQFPD